MTQSMEGENAAFWLPTHFLTDDDFLAVKQHPPRNSLFGSDPFDSPVSSNDNDENNTPENDDVFLLTRHLAGTSIHDSYHTKQNSTSERPLVFSTSPQSTLSGYGGGWSNAPSRVPSPELQNDAAWDLLYEAAGQVARLKMNAIAAKLNNGLLARPRHSSAFTTSYDKQYQELKWAQNSNNLARLHHNDGCCNHLQRRSCGGALGVPPSAWPALTTRQPLQHHARQSTCGSQLRGIYQGGPGTVVPTLGGVKRQSTGTGVFLPRRVSNSPPRHHHHHHPHQLQLSEYRKKSPVEDANLKAQMRFGGAGFSTDHEIMVARRNAVFSEQQRRNVLLARTEKNTGAVVGQGGHEIRLPNDWTY